MQTEIDMRVPGKMANALIMVSISILMEMFMMDNGETI